MGNEFSRKRIAKVSYDVTTDQLGGAAGSRIPTISEIIPKGSIITRVIAIGRTLAGGTNISVTGGGVTIIGAQTITTNCVDGTACTDLLRAGAIVTALGYIPIVTTSSVPLSITTTGTMTSGGCDFYIEYQLA